MFSTLFADAACDVRRIGPVLEVAAAGSCQRGASAPDHSSSVLVSPHTRFEAEVVERLAEWLAGVDRIEKLLRYAGGKSLLGYRQSPGSLRVTVGPTAFGATTAGMPACRCAVLRRSVGSHGRDQLAYVAGILVGLARLARSKSLRHRLGETGGGRRWN